MPVTMKLNRHHLKFRFDNTRTGVGTCQYHAFLPISNTTLIAKKYSKAQNGTVEAVAESRSESQTIPFETVRRYIAVLYEDHWYLGYVLEKYEENEEFKIRFLHPYALSPSLCSHFNQMNYFYMCLILSVVTPISENGRTYKL
jgi:hypothetical protein